MALYIPHSIFHLARLLYVRPETFGPYYVSVEEYVGEKSPDVKGLEIITLVTELPLSMLLKILRGGNLRRRTRKQMTHPNIFSI